MVYYFQKELFKERNCMMNQEEVFVVTIELLLGNPLSVDSSVILYLIGQRRITTLTM